MSARGNGALRRRALERAIEDDRAALALALDEVRVAVRRQWSLGPRLAEGPLPWVVGAFALGFWAGWRA
ncbi:MAG: hypothetical protein AB7N76_09895 [Planctomycetota bacterium]